MVALTGCTSDEEQIEDPVSSDAFQISSPPDAEEVTVPSFAPVHFAFDSSVVEQRYADNLENISQYLKDNPGSIVEIEGHCDERGTEQYNLALGDRRAQAIKDLLIKYGAPLEQLATVSYGEERPAVEGHEESAWSMNRRAEFTLRLKSY